MEFSKKDREILRLLNLRKNEESYFHDGDEVTVVSHEIRNGCAAQFTGGKTRYEFRLSNGKEIIIVASWPSDALASNSPEWIEDDELMFDDSRERGEVVIGAIGIAAASRMSPHLFP